MRVYCLRNTQQASKFININMSSKNQTKTQPQNGRKPYCKVCEDSGKSQKEYTSHFPKGLNGVVTCPTLLSQYCKKCAKKGHTASYCKQTVEQLSALPRCLRTIEPAKVVPVKKTATNINRFASAFGDSDDDNDSDEETQTKPKTKPQQKTQQKPQEKTTKKEDFPALTSVVKKSPIHVQQMSYSAAAAKEPFRAQIPATVPHLLSSLALWGTNKYPKGTSWADMQDSDEEEEKEYYSPLHTDNDGWDSYDEDDARY